MNTTPEEMREVLDRALEMQAFALQDIMFAEKDPIKRAEIKHEVEILMILRLNSGSKKDAPWPNGEEDLDVFLLRNGLIKNTKPLRHDINEVYKDWCAANCNDSFTPELFLEKHGVCFEKFYKIHWDNGLQEYWLKYTEERSGRPTPRRKTSNLGPSRA